MEFKQMENFYKKVIYDITQLIINKNYKRAITLGQFLLSKGFRTNQLIVAISYAHKQLYGPKSGIQFLQKYSQNQQNNQQEGDLQKMRSPLIQLAFSQYRIENKKIKQAHQNIQQLQKLSDQFSQDSGQNRLFKILKQLHKNFQPQNSEIIDKQHLYAQNPDLQQSQVEFLTKQINHVTQMYLNLRDHQIQQDKIQGSQIAVKYGHFYVQYSEIKTKILTLLTEKIKSNSFLAVNKKIKRKQNKFLKDIQGNNTPKRIQIKQLTKSQLKQQQNFQNNQQTNGKFVQKRQQFIIPLNQIQQLQSLLAYANGFITFFKSRLKDFGGSRLKQFQLNDQQTQQQNNS